MIFNIAAIIDTPGSLPFDYSTDFGELEINFQNPFVNPVSISGEVRNTAGLIELYFHCGTVIRFECTRCTEIAERDFSLSSSAVLAEQLEDPDSYENADIALIENNSVDIDEIVRSAVILESDMIFLCDEDCRGICPGCGKNLNEGDCGCKPAGDPRFDKLRELLE